MRSQGRGGCVLWWDGKRGGRKGLWVGGRGEEDGGVEGGGDIEGCWERNAADKEGEGTDERKEDLGVRC